MPHFAARWCAKEALKKCDRAYLAIDGKDVEVAHDEAGAPHPVHLAAGSPGRVPGLLILLNLIAIALAAVALSRTLPGLRWPFPG